MAHSTERPAGMQDTSVGCCTALSIPVGECGQCHAVSVRSSWTQTCLLFCHFNEFVFSALTLLVGRREEHPVWKNWVTRCWCGYLSGARCSLFALLCSWCHCHPKTPSSLALFEFIVVLPSWCRLTQVVLEKRPLNGCSSSGLLF